MGRFECALLAAVAAIGFVSIASAADLPTKAPAYVPPYNWTGFYVGAHIGGAWSKLGVNDYDEFVGGNFSNDSSGIFGGGQLGYNFQSGQFVFGVEVDLGAMGLRNSSFEPGTGNIIQSNKSSGFYADVTGRLGYAWDRSLLYAKGGYAFYRANINVDDIGEAISNSKNVNGWTLGGGFEQMISNTPWSWKLEYQYFDFGTVRVVMPTDGDRFDNKLTVQTVKVGLNYKFGSLAR